MRVDDRSGGLVVPVTGLDPGPEDRPLSTFWAKGLGRDSRGWGPRSPVTTQWREGKGSVTPSDR